MNCSTPGFPILHCLPEFAQTYVHWVGDAIQPSHPLLPPSSPALNLSQHQSSESALPIRWPKYWSFSFSISPSNEYSGLICFKIDWFDLLAIPRDSHESSPAPQLNKASVLRCSAFFTVLLSHPYLTTGNTIALTRRIFVSKVMSLFLIRHLGLSQRLLHRHF